MAKRDPILHKGHRERMKNRILKNGFDGMNDHQIAEAMLFFSIPQGDTNETAHRLVNECGGSIVGVINTPYKKLITIKGIGAHTAHLINFIRLISQYYLKKSYIEIRHNNRINGSPDLCDYFKRVFVGTEKEELHVAAFDDDYQLIAERKIGEGGFNGVSVVPRKIFDFAAECGCTCIAIAHNHPVGSCLPSIEDVEIMIEFVKYFRYFDVKIADHIIVGNDDAFSMRSSIYKKQIWGNED